VLAGAQVAPGEPPLDRLLALLKPVERPVEVVLVRPLDPELGGERGVGEAPGRGQLRRRIEDALDDEGEREGALARRRAVEQARKLESPGHRERGLRVSVRKALLDREGLVRGQEALALQVAADQPDELRWQVRDVADGLVSDLAALAVGAAQQVGDVLAARRPHPAVGDDVDRASSGCHCRSMTAASDDTKASLMTTTRQMRTAAKPLPVQDQRLPWP